MLRVSSCVLCIGSRKVALVIEEIKTGLPPAAQRNLVRFLLELCWEKPYR